MQDVYWVDVQPLTRPGFGVFGVAVGRDGNQPPDSAGDGWQCWYPLGEMRANDQKKIGLVRSEPRAPVLLAMERHQDREEWVYALDRPIIQAVALSSSASPDEPDPETVHAFVIEPGTGALIAPGVWHAAALPRYDEVAYYGFLLGTPKGQGQDSGWVQFQGAALVQLRTEDR